METKIRFVVVFWQTRIMASPLYFLDYALAQETVDSLGEGIYQIDKVFIRE